MNIKGTCNKNRRVTKTEKNVADIIGIADILS